MIPLFIGITAVNLLCLAVATWLGWGVSHGRDWGAYHQLAGALAALVCVGVHCIVFTYFMATAKWIQHAIEVKQLDPRIAAPTRSFKAQALPAALLAMSSTFASALFGAATFSHYLQGPNWHLGSAMIAILINALVAPVEYRAIARNGRLIDSILTTSA